MRLAIVTSHPIQYQAPWFQALAQVLDVQVFFAQRQTADGQARAGFGTPFEWDVPLLEGYSYEWLRNVARIPDVNVFSGCDTPDIRDRLSQGRFDACLVNGWYLKSYVQAVRAAWRLGVPVLMRGDSQLATRRSPWLAAAKYWPYRWWLRRIDAHLFVGRRNREYLEHYGVTDRQLFFTPHFVDNARFRSAAARARSSGEAVALRQTFGATAAARVVLFAGKLVESKRPVDVVDAVAGLRAQGNDVIAVFVGSGGLAQAVERQARSRNVPVVMAGFRNQSEMPIYYAAADVLVLPSDARETWGLVVNEAMAAGLPVVVSDAAGCSIDLVEAGSTGFVFPCGDVPALAAALTRACDLRERQPVETQSALTRRLSYYSIDAAVDGVRTALRAVRPLLA